MESENDLNRPVVFVETVAEKNPGLPRPYYQDEHVTLYHGDCRELLPLMPKVDLVLTDPPYGIGWEGHPKSDIKWQSIANDTSTSVVEFLFGWLEPSQNAVVFGANCFPGLLPHRGRWLCWDKRCSEKADRMLGSPFELAWINKRSGFDSMFRVLHGGVVNKNGGKRVHPTEKPITLMSQIIQVLYPESSTIIDPFAGGGTTLRAAKDLGLSCVGIELEEKYCEVTANRMRQEVLGL
jgi:DNA modification methylase